MGRCSIARTAAEGRQSRCTLGVKWGCGRGSEGEIIARGLQRATRKTPEFATPTFHSAALY
jgi:hypothetical protein